MAIYKEDFVDIDLNIGSIHRSFMNRTIGEGDALANRFGIRAFRNGEAETLGGTCTGYFIRPDGGTIVIAGTVSGNTAYVDLPQACYAYEGQFALAIKVASGSVTGTMRIVDGVVANTTTDTVVDPGTIIPSIETLIAEIEAAVASIPADYSGLWAAVAPVFSTSKSYSIGDIITHDGGMYRFIVPHTGSWSASDVETADIGTILTNEMSLYNCTERQLDSSAVVVGGINNETGQNKPDSTKLRVTTLITDSIRTVRTVGKYKFAVYAWQFNGTYVGRYITEGTFSSASNKTAVRFSFLDFDKLKAEYNEYFFRIVMLKTDNSDTSVNDCKYLYLGIKEEQGKNPFIYAMKGQINDSTGVVDYTYSNVRFVMSVPYKPDGDYTVTVNIPENTVISLKRYTDGTYDGFLPAVSNKLTFNAVKGCEYKFTTKRSDSNRMTFQELASIRLLESALNDTTDGYETSIENEIGSKTGATTTYDANTGNTIHLDSGSTLKNDWSLTKVKVHAGQAVTIEFYGKASHIEPSDDTGAGMYIEFIKENGSRVGNKYNGYILSKNRFGFHRYGCVCPEGAQIARVRFFTRANTTADIRNISVKVHDGYQQRNRSGILYDGHLGMVYSAPENTMAGLELGKVAGFQTMIVNVKQTSDGELVCCHDASINRTARNADGTELSSTVYISSSTYDDLLDYDFGIWFDEAYAGTKIPTFEEAAKYISIAGMGLGTSIHRTQTSSNLNVNKFCEVYKKYGMNGNSFVKSFNFGFLQSVYEILGDSIGYIYVEDNVTTAMIDAVAAFPGRCWMEFKTTGVTQELLDYAYSLGVPVSVYFGNDLLKVRDFINKGVTRFCVDTFPDNVFPIDAADNEVET